MQNAGCNEIRASLPRLLRSEGAAGGSESRLGRKIRFRRFNLRQGRGEARRSNATFWRSIHERIARHSNVARGGRIGWRGIHERRRKRDSIWILGIGKRRRERCAKGWRRVQAKSFAVGFHAVLFSFLFLDCRFLAFQSKNIGEEPRTKASVLEVFLSLAIPVFLQIALSFADRIGQAGV